MFKVHGSKKFRSHKSQKDSRPPIFLENFSAKTVQAAKENRGATEVLPRSRIHAFRGPMRDRARLRRPPVFAVVATGDLIALAGMNDLGHPLDARGTSRWLNARNIVVTTCRSETLLGGALIAVLG